MFKYPIYLLKAINALVVIYVINARFRKASKQLPLISYFIKAYVAGLMCGGAVKDKEDNVFALFVAIWASLLIAMDAASDFQQISTSDTEKLLEQTTLFLSEVIYLKDNVLCYDKEISDDYLIAADRWMSSEYANLSIALATQLSTVLFRVISTGDNLTQLRSNIAEFERNLKELARGQHCSLKQIFGEREVTWEYYVNNIMDRKFANIFTTPLSVLPTNSSQAVRRDDLLLEFGSVNGIYLHRQMLDDFLDIEEDIRNGAVAAPLLILLTLPSYRDGEPFDLISLYENEADVAPMQFAKYYQAKLTVAGDLALKEALRSAVKAKSIVESLNAQHQTIADETASCLLDCIRASRVVDIYIDLVEARVKNLRLRRLGLFSHFRMDGSGRLGKYYYYRCQKSFQMLKRKWNRYES